MNKAEALMNALGTPTFAPNDVRKLIAVAELDERMRHTDDDQIAEQLDAAVSDFKSGFALTEEDWAKHGA